MPTKIQKPKGYALPDEVLKSLRDICKAVDYIRKSQYWTAVDVEKNKVFARTGVQVLIQEVFALDALFTKHQIGFKNGTPLTLFKPPMKEHN